MNKYFLVKTEKELDKELGENWGNFPPGWVTTFMDNLYNKVVEVKLGSKHLELRNGLKRSIFLNRNWVEYINSDMAKILYGKSSND